MAQAVAAAVVAIKAVGSYLAAASAASAAGTATIAQSAALIAANVATAAAVSAVGTLLAPNVGAGGSATDWTANPDAPIPFAAGRVGTAGQIVHRRTFGPNLMYQGFVTVVSGAGPIKSFVSFSGDDQAVTFDVNGKANSSQWTDEMWFRSQLGAQPTATALASPAGLQSGATLPAWGSAYKLNGKAAFMLTLAENSKRTAYPTGEPKPLLVIEGLFGWDPRQDSTYPGGAGSCRLNNPATWVYLENPILWALKWALGLWEGPTGKGAPQVDYQVGGIGAKVEGIKVDRFVAAANIADANGWTVSAWPTTDDDKAQVLDAFLQAGGAVYASEQGKISCIQRAAPRSSVATISVQDTAGPIQIDTAASRLNRINTIRPRFMSEANRWQMTAINEVTSSTYRTEDGGTRTRGVDFPYVPQHVQAGQLAALQIAHSRESIAGVVPLKPHLQEIRPGDAFTITEPGFVLDGLKCLALSTDFDPATKVHTVTFVSETDGKYPFALGQSPDAPVAPTLTPGSIDLPAPPIADWTLTARPADADGTQQPGLILSGAVSVSAARFMLVEVGESATGPWRSVYFGPPVTEGLAIDGLQPGVDYWVAVSYYNAALRQSLPRVYGPVTAPGLAPVGGGGTITPGAVGTVNTPTILYQVQKDGRIRSLLNLTWTAATNAIGYHVEITPSYDASAWWIEPADGLSLRNYGLSTGHSYTLRVRGVSSTMTFGPWSSSVSTGTIGGDTTPPGQITSPSVLGGIRQNHLYWINPTDADYRHLRIYRNTSATYVGSSLVNPAATDTSWDDSGVTAGVTYYYWGRTEDHSGNLNATYEYMGTAAPRLVIGGVDTDPVDVEISNRPRVELDNRVIQTNFDYADGGFGVIYNSAAVAVTKTVGESGGRRYFQAAYSATASGQQVSVGTAGSAFRFRVTPGERLSVQLRVGATGPVASVLPAIRFYDSQGGSPISAPYIGGGALSGPQTFGTLVQDFITVPGGAFWAEIENYVQSSGAGAITNTISEPMVAAASAVQTAHPPYSAGDAAIPGRMQYIDNAGRVVDGRGLPVNVSGYVLDPVVQMAAGSPPDTSIALVGGTATLQGGATISLPSGSISGLSAATPYAVFRDLQAGAYVALASGATGYFTDTSRYLRLGIQTTADNSGGTYTPPPPAPPGYMGGGGLADRYEDGGPI